MMQQRLEDTLLGNYGELRLFLQGRGYVPEEARPKGFALYQIVPPGEAAGQPGAYFAMRRLQKTVEKAIFWEAGSLEEAVSLLDKLPRQPVQHHNSYPKDYRQAIFAGMGGGLAAGTAMLSGLGVSRALLAGSLGGLVGMIGFYALSTGSDAMRALAIKATYWLALRDFRNASVDRDAVAVLTEFFEV